MSLARSADNGPRILSHVHSPAPGPPQYYCTIRGWWLLSRQNVSLNVSYKYGTFFHDRSVFSEATCIRQGKQNHRKQRIVHGFITVNLKRKRNYTARNHLWGVQLLIPRRASWKNCRSRIETNGRERDRGQKTLHLKNLYSARKERLVKYGPLHVTTITAMIHHANTHTAPSSPKPPHEASDPIPVAIR